MSGLHHKNGSPSHRRTWVLISCVLLLGLGIFTCLEIRSLWVRRGGSGPSPALSERGKVAPEVDQELIATTPAAMVTDILSSSNLRAMEADPGDIAPPPQAVFLWGFQGSAAGCVQQQGRYEYSGEQSAAVEHYLGVLSGKRFRLLRDNTDPSGRRELLFSKDATTVNLSLRKRSRRDKIIIVLIVSHPGR